MVLNSLIKEFNTTKSVNVFNKIKEEMISDEVINLKETFLDDNYTFSDDDIKLLESLLLSANIIYSDSGDDTGMTDSEYDMLISKYEKLTNKELPIGAPLLTSSNKAISRYLSLRGTLYKIYKLTDDDVLANKSQNSIDDWFTKIKNIYKENTGKKLNVEELEVTVVPKFDGISVVCEFTKNGDLIRAITRGDTDNNESKDITNVIKYVFPKGPFTNAKSEYAVKCEAMVLNKDLEELNYIMHKEYKNTRAIAAGILNTNDIDESLAKYLHLIQLRYSYFEDGNESDQYMSSDMYNWYLTTNLTKEGLYDIRKWAMEHSNVYPGYRCDGCVICIMNEDVRKALGRSSNKQNYEAAYKFTMEYGISTVKDIIFQVGNFGRVTPVVVFKKIKLKGNEVKKATISYSDFLKYRLAKGDEVRVVYDIIPYIIIDDKLKRSSNKPIKVPFVCPECGSTLLETESGKQLICDNPKCECRIKGKILNFITKMGIDNISYETVNDFYSKGYLKTIDDIYKLENKAKEISNIPGYGIVSISRILKSIDNSKVCYPSRLLGSIGIEGVSTKKFHDLMQYISYEELLESGFNKDIDSLIGIPGIQEKSSHKIIDGIYINRKLIEDLEKFITVLDEPLDKSSFKVTFTKVRDDKLEDYIRSLGGIVDNSSVTKNTSFLVVPKKGISSSKVSKAIKLNIPIIEINDVKRYLKDELKLTK